MTQPVTYYVNVSIALEGSGPQPAGFGVPAFIHEHALESARMAGPFTTAQDVLDAGHSSGSPPHLWAQSLLAQSPRITSFYIGRRDSGDADDGEAFDACIAENPGAAYAWMTALRDDTESLALAAAIEASAFPKIGMVQTNGASLLAGTGPTYSVASVTGSPPPANGDYDLTFTGFGLSSPIDVTVTVASDVANDTELMAALDAALDTAAGGGGDLEDIVDPASIENATGTLTFAILDGLPTGTVTYTAQSGTVWTITLTDGDLGSRMFDAQYTRTALVYHPTDAEYLDGAWMSRCLSANLDRRKIGWFAKRLNGIAGTSLTSAQTAAIRAVNANFYAPVTMSSGLVESAFTAQGWFPAGSAGAGRRIDVTTTLDWGKSRLEEALFGVNLRETHEVGYDDPGINRYVAAAEEHYGIGARAGHYLDGFIVPEGQDYAGTRTPVTFAPKLSETTTTERQNRILTFDSLVYLRPGIERVVYTVEARQ